MIIRFRRRVSRRKLLEEMAIEHESMAALRAAASRDASKRAALEEWRFHLRHPDPDEIVSVERVMIFHEPRKFLRAWTPQRLAMYDFLKAHRDVQSLRDLAGRLRRNYRNVYEDAHELAATGILTLERHAGALVPRLVADELTITV